MRGGLTATALVRDPLQAAVDARLDARLDRASAAPVALGLSGGGDSLALLHLAAEWCAGARRPLLALTVDHALHPQSAGWTARAGRMAEAAGARWRPLAWAGPKPASGLPAAARAARHALLADAAREAGAAVLLLAHTADDLAETEALRAGDAPGIGRLRAWAPSPAWPQGRGVFLLRPLLGVRRAELRAWLGGRELAWLDDPANADPRFARARLRLAGVDLPPCAEREPDSGFGDARTDGTVRLPRARLVLGEPGALRTLSAAVACAAGCAGSPRSAPVAYLLGRLSAGYGPARSATANAATMVTSTLGGAWVQAQGATVRLGREGGRRPPADLLLSADVPAVWDGRFEARTREPGWRVAAAGGRLARLAPSERSALQALPPPLRRLHPVFVRGDEVTLRPHGADLLALAPARFDAAVGRVAREAQLRPAPPG